MSLIIDNAENEMTAEFPSDAFTKITEKDLQNLVVRPSRSYWQDAYFRILNNRSALFAFGLICFLFSFSFMGHFIWNKDPSYQDLNSPSQNPTLGQLALIVGEDTTYEPERVSLEKTSPNLTSATENSVRTPAQKSEVSPELNLGLTTLGNPTTQHVILKWNYLEGSSGYTLYRNEIAPTEESLGVPIAEIDSAEQISFQDNQSLEARTYFYTLIPKDAQGEPQLNLFKKSNGSSLKVEVMTALNLNQAQTLGFNAQMGDQVRMPPAPLGTDSLGRDILARLISGGKVSLSIGLIASLLSVFFGIILGGISGFFGGTTDVVLMRFTDLITGLPFLLFMILLKVVLNVGPGESGVTALLISLVILSWTGTARLVRGQILQLRQSEFVQAARLMGAKPIYLIIRHLLPNLMGVILVTLTFQIPSAIFTEAFLSFIGLGVAAPATSWGSMCNDAVQSLLTRPYEFFAPSIVISLTVLSFNLLGDGLRDALDPKLRSNE